jgi:hypothetical protein
MPRKLVMEAWRDKFGADYPHIFRRKYRIVVPSDSEEEAVAPVGAFDEARDNAVMEYFARPFAKHFLVSPVAMRIRLERLGLLLREAPRQRSLLVRTNPFLIRA